MLKKKLVTPDLSKDKDEKIPGNKKSNSFVSRFKILKLSPSRYMLAYATAENALTRLKNFKGKFQKTAEKDLSFIRENKKPEDDIAAVRRLRRPDEDLVATPLQKANTFEGI